MKGELDLTFFKMISIHQQLKVINTDYPPAPATMVIAFIRGTPIFRWLLERPDFTAQQNVANVPIVLKKSESKPMWSDGIGCRLGRLLRPAFTPAVSSVPVSASLAS